MIEEQTNEQTEYKADPNAVDWKAGASEGNRSALENYDSFDAFIEAKKSFETSARTKSSIPTDDSADEVWTAHYEKLAPKTIEEYKLDLPEGTTPLSRIDDIKTAAKTEGVTTRQFAKLAPIVNDVIASEVDAIRDIIAPSKEDGVKVLTVEWKGDTEKNIKLANDAFCKFGGEEFVKWAKDTGVANQPLFIKAFYKIQESTMDDVLVDGSPSAAPQAKPSPHGEAFNKRYPSEAPA